jgi:mannose-6-phosphate isomerase-like protein (cupin superfamily)
MEPCVARLDPASEQLTRERCSIAEVWNDESDPDVSVARSRVAPGVTTELHALDVDERYVIAAGRGVVEAGELREPVGPGDVVVIPAGAPQRVTNDGDDDLVFYCVCTPRFRPHGYRALE